MICSGDLSCIVKAHALGSRSWGYVIEQEGMGRGQKYRIAPILCNLNICCSVSHRCGKAGEHDLRVARRTSTIRLYLDLFHSKSSCAVWLTIRKWFKSMCLHFRCTNLTIPLGRRKSFLFAVRRDGWT